MRTYKYCNPIFCLLILLIPYSIIGIEPGTGPQSGDIYREYSIFPSDEGSGYWRVTNPNAISSGAKRFLPNPVMRFEISDLTQAIKAEAVIDYWGGHTGTIDRKFSINDNKWIELPYPATIQQRPYNYAFQMNAIVDVPLEHLLKGRNTITGTCSHVDSTSWGQWGWYRITFRVYYDESKPHPSGQILAPVSGETIGDIPNIIAEGNSNAGVSHINIIGFYDGYDVDGNGIYADWHRNYNGRRLEDHIGYDGQEPFAITWDTKWIPDQDNIQIRAHIADNNGYVYVTEPVTNLSLQRNDRIVKMYHATGVHEDFAVRMGEKAACQTSIPDRLFNASEASLHLRTWNGYNHGERNWGYLNDWRFTPPGENHCYDYGIKSIPVSVLQEKSNKILFTSSTHEHGVEILWPGPSIAVSYSLELAAYWEASAYSGAAPMKIYFNGQKSVVPRNQEITDYSWNFRDGTIANGDTVSHVFENPGLYAVELTITDNNGETATHTEEIYIHDAQFAIDCKSVAASYDKSPYDKCKSIDGNFDTFWMSVGDGQWIQYDLRALKTLQACYLAFSSGDKTTYRFSIETSVDSVSWNATSNSPFTSSGYSTEYELFNFDDVTAQWIRIVFHGSSFTANSVSEFAAYGSDSVSTDVEIGTMDQAMPEEFILHQNYPNPFNPATKICYSIPKQANIKLTVHNILGQHIKTLADDNFPAGKYTVEWNGTDTYGQTVGNGIYFYKIQTDEFSEVRKMVVLR
ncbi:T9SS type A sorting domain-containing protein [candidate division KSB1 bacterium]|nr:T9SS type A sorting domain-containing protein [candidate division KSB1 bacterium]